MVSYNETMTSMKLWEKVFHVSPIEDTTTVLATSSINLMLKKRA